ncbi:MAG: methyltransferase domain-containing protein [Steroidobacteraceae bacterium]
MPTPAPLLEPWLAGPLGSAVLRAEAELLHEALDDVFGWELVQMGLWGAARELLGGCRTQRKTVVAQVPHRLSSQGNNDGAPDVIARLSQLPIANASVDAVLLPHTLEFETDPYAVVREADRVLAGEGQLLVLGFRPWGLWGLRGRAVRRGFPPGARRSLSDGRVKDWLELLGYDVVTVKRYLFAPPWGQPEKSPTGGSLLLKRGWLRLWPAGAYLLKARKRVYTLTPIRPRYRERPQVIGGLVKPTTRNRPEAG